MVFRFVVLTLPGAKIVGKLDTWYLYTDNWDDGFRFETTFFLQYTDRKGTNHDIGTVKIAQFGMGEGAPRDPSPGWIGVRYPQIPSVFENLGVGFFSLGQDADFYKNLSALGSDVRTQVLSRLNDIAFDKLLYANALSQYVTQASLMRSVNQKMVEGQFHRIATGGVLLSRYRFSHFSSEERSKTTNGLLFQVDPYSQPPTNIHVLIGRNGVGKTRFLDRMCRALVGAEAPEEPAVVRFQKELPHDPTSFSKVISVSFSAFDILAPVLPQADTDYVYVGLKQPEMNGRPKSSEMLAGDFVESVENCLRAEERLVRWRTALARLEADPEFREFNFARLADIYESDSSVSADAIADLAEDMFMDLSSGHKIVLLTITKLVEHVEEASLVLIDEPESHLHPPLLSAFVRALADLLVDRNGVAIVATHSPVVLQEVPRECVWILTGRADSIARRPDRETFAENVSVLTDTVFELEVTDSGFHQLLEEAVKKGGTYEEIIEDFKGRVGSEGRIILRSLIATRDSGVVG